MFAQGERIEGIIVPIVADQMDLTIDLVDKINRFQWKLVEDATRTCNRIEVTDFFTLKTEDYLVDKSIKRFEDIKKGYTKQLSSTEDEIKKAKLTSRLRRVEEDIKFLRSKYGKI